MKILPKQIAVRGIEIELVRKKVKRLALKIFAPDGKVRVTAPLSVHETFIVNSIEQKVDWILGHQARFKALPKVVPMQFVSGEMHPFLGSLYPLQVEASKGRAGATLKDGVIRLSVPSHAMPLEMRDLRESYLLKWYRAELHDLSAPLILKWESILKVKVAAFGIKRMKTRWGTCNTRDHRIWLSLELIKKSEACIETVIVHELAHLLERSHGPKFKAIMDQVHPEWRKLEAELKNPRGEI